MPDTAFADAMPLRQHEYEQDPDGLVTVLVPKFTGRIARRLLVPFLRQPFIRMRLDTVGSAVWLACDGRTTVARLAVMVAEGSEVAPEKAGERVAVFLRQLAREGSVTFAAPGAATGRD